MSGFARFLANCSNCSIWLVSGGESRVGLGVEEPPRPSPSRLARFGKEFQFGRSFADRSEAWRPPVPDSAPPKSLQKSLFLPVLWDPPPAFSRPGPFQFGLNWRPLSLATCAPRAELRGGLVGFIIPASPPIPLSCLFLCSPSLDEDSSARRAASSESDRSLDVVFAGALGTKPGGAAQPGGFAGACASLEGDES